MSTNAARHARRSRLGAPLPRAFYDRETELVSRDLLGAVLRCETPEGVASGRIVETEAYLGEHDAACHAAAGETERTRWLYGPPGVAYVYFIYGVHWCMNAVTRAEGLPSAVLVRALEPLEGLDLMRERRRHPRSDRDLTNGPGKLCAALGITGAMNGWRLDDSGLTIHRGTPVPDDEVVVTPRIGITRAADWPLRWYVADSPYVSRTPRHFPRHRHAP
ncbi:MAG TPA: DNA-3-methyladenine glycosylase [Gemmatimonadaceae bacterium]